MLLRPGFWRRPWVSAILVWLFASLVYLSVLGPRLLSPTPDQHFVHLANSFLHGQLEVVGNRPLGNNDWACFDALRNEGCAAGSLFSGQGREGQRWYVSFPPFPAVLLMPFVLFFGTGIPDRAIFGLLAGLGPAAVWWLLESLRRWGASPRTWVENLTLVALYAFGTVFFFTAVQGTVWFAAHVVAVPLIAAYLTLAYRGEHPFWAGLLLALAFITRPTTALLALFFLLQAWGRARPASALVLGTHPLARAVSWLAGAEAKPLLFRCTLFAVPILAIGLGMMAMNHARFGDPFEFGHGYLQVRWRPRIERWGLFNYHYLAKNLSVFWAGLPWLSRVPPYVQIGGHGLALWFTTPALLWVFFPKRPWSPLSVSLALSAAVVALLNLTYQNSGWVQFGYRFALDYLPLLFALLALGGRRFGPGFAALAAFSLLVNGFGAVTFDRVSRFYHVEATQNVLFQPD